MALTSAYHKLQFDGGARPLMARDILFFICRAVGPPMDKNLHARVLKYVKAEQPLGPADAHQIDDPEVAALLFDPHNTSFNTLLKKDISLVIGRRGSGKTALLNSYLYKPYFAMAVLNAAQEARLDVSDYKIVIPILSHKLFEQMQAYVTGSSAAWRPIESIIEAWADLLIDHILASLLHSSSDAGTNDQLEIIRSYLSAPELRKKSEAYRLVWGTDIWGSLKSKLLKKGDNRKKLASKQEAWQACIGFLDHNRHRAVVIFDSMDEYEIGNPTVDRTIGGLLRFVSQFNNQHERIKVKLGLPSEVFPEIQRASANPLKDFVSFDQVRWTSVELARISAHRYRLFLSLFDADCFSEIMGIDLNKRDGIRRFWGRFLSEPQKNRYGHEENSMTYMLRHTQLLPRQFFRILQRVVLESFSTTGGYRLLTGNAVVSSISDMEPIIAGEIIQGFKYVYPYAENLSKAMFGSFPTVFSYDQLEDKWRKVGRAFMRKHEAEFELVHLTEMLLRMGIIGTVEAETEKYVVAEFAYHKLIPPAVGDRHEFAVHPVFSRYFSCSRNRQGKAILPHGASLDILRTS